MAIEEVGSLNIVDVKTLDVGELYASYTGPCTEAADIQECSTPRQKTFWGALAQEILGTEHHHGVLTLEGGSAFKRRRIAAAVC
jgi:hypothetical protein